MPRDELERLSKVELIELMLRLQRPEKTSRTSSKSPSTDRKERREQARPGGAKPGHEGHSRMLSTEADRVVGHAPQQCPGCHLVLSPDLPSEAVSVHERIELPQIKPMIEHYRRLAVQCPGCGTRVVAAPPHAEQVGNLTTPEPIKSPGPRWSTTPPAGGAVSRSRPRSWRARSTRSLLSA